MTHNDYAHNLLQRDQSSRSHAPLEFRDQRAARLNGLDDFYLSCRQARGQAWAPRRVEADTEALRSSPGRRPRTGDGRRRRRVLRSEVSVRRAAPSAATCQMSPFISTVSFRSRLSNSSNGRRRQTTPPPGDYPRSLFARSSASSFRHPHRHYGRGVSRLPRRCRCRSAPSAAPPRGLRPPRSPRC